MQIQTHSPKHNGRSQDRAVGSGFALGSAAFALGILNLHAASVIQFSATAYPATEGAGQVRVIAQRTNDVESVVSVEFFTTNLTATEGLDYIGTSSLLTFGAGETNKSVNVEVVNDILVEPDESFQVRLTNPTAGAILGSRSIAIVRITDNDLGLQVQYASYGIAEDGAVTRIGVTRQDNGDFPVTVEFATTDKTAVVGLDYVATNGVLAFAAGETLKTVDVWVLNDGLSESQEYFMFTLANPTGGGGLGKSVSARITIMDNDPGVSLERPLYVLGEEEGALNVRVLRGNDMELSPFSVEFRTADLTATGGVDYVSHRRTLEFAAGEAVKTVAIEVLADTVEEVDERFRLILTNLVGAPSLGGSNATIYLLDGTGFLPHRVGQPVMRQDGSLELQLDGAAPRIFVNDFDAYPIDASTDLLHWERWSTPQRANASSNALPWLDSDAAGAAMRFYRTLPHHSLSPFPKPPGPFPVGLVSRVVTDPLQRDRYLTLPGEARFMISVWYPAVAESGTRSARLEDEMVVLKVPVGALARRHRFRSSAQSEVPCAIAEAPYPIVVYSPGGAGLRTELAERGPYLASHGYVVVAADPMDAPVSVLPDGTVMVTADTNPRFTSRVRDLEVVLNELVRWNTDDPMFRGRFATTNVAVAGWSYGAGAAAELCRLDARCRAAISYEGYYQGAQAVLSTGLSKPLLSIYAGSLFDATTASVLHDRAAVDSIWFQIRSTDHESFSDYYWANSPARGREAATIVNNYTLWFLDKYLRNYDVEMPDPVNYPRIFNLKRK